jgi:hypothetical protein
MRIPFCLVTRNAAGYPGPAILNALTLHYGAPPGCK